MRRAEEIKAQRLEDMLDFPTYLVAVGSVIPGTVSALSALEGGFLKSLVHFDASNSITPF